jgi:cytochrome c
MKKAAFAMLTAVLAATFTLTVPVRSEEKKAVLSIEDKILEEKCSLCHSSKRIFSLEPDEIRPTLERMMKMNPDWFTEIDRDHVAEALAKILNNSSVIAARKAWQEAVDRGEALFKDNALAGGTDQACNSCHEANSLAKVHDAYPQYQPESKRFISLEDKINEMIVEYMGGQAIPRQDQRMVDLISFLKN